MRILRSQFNNLVRNTAYCINCRASSSVSHGFQDIVLPENKERCRKSLYHGTAFRNLAWMKGKDGIKKAAVLVPLCTVSGEPALLYTLRSNQLSSHKGQVSFPGGKHDDTDQHMLETALREAEEEIGLSEKNVDVWGQMAPIPGKDFETAVTPILGNCGEIDIHTLNPNPDEVEYVFTVSIEKLCDPQLNGYTYFKKAGYALPVFVGGPERIWGLTAIITHMCLKLIVLDKKLYTVDIPWSNRVFHRKEK